jgi:hypothetical protein
MQISFNPLSGQFNLIKKATRGISCFLSDSSGNLLGEFKSGILIGDENKFLITQSGEQLLTQSSEELICN